uniref:Uncharacterized protein n=1 Tax=Caenorhabditis japonica TaxID=281687 RepID=A0A8R1HYH2_CAEJA
MCGGNAMTNQIVFCGRFKNLLVLLAKLTFALVRTKETCVDGGSPMLLRVALINLCLMSGVLCWTNEQLLETISLACKIENYVCPKDQYGIFNGYLWKWNIENIISSDLAHQFRRARYLSESILSEIRDTYCCFEGPCLARCGIFEKSEIDLVEGFPGNAQTILNLNLPELEPYREYVTNWLKTHLDTKFPTGRLPARLEDFFDALYKYQDLIRTKLRENELFTVAR